MNGRLKRLEKQVQEMRGPELPFVLIDLVDGGTIEGMLRDVLRLDYENKVAGVRMGNDADLFNLCKELL